MLFPGTHREEEPEKADGVRFIIWLVTGRCNFSCRHCYASRFAGCPELEESEAERLVREAAAVGVRYISLTGGEVFLRPEVLKLLRLMRELGIRTSVVTNGSCLSDEVLETLRECETFVFLSVDGARRETHEAIRGSGTWDFIFPAVERLHKYGIGFSTVMSASKLNFEEIPSYLELSRDLGSLRGCIIPTMPSGRATMDLVLSPEEMLRALRLALEAAERLQFHVSWWCTPFAYLAGKSKYVSCSFCRLDDDEMDLDPQGNVLLCDVLDDVLGNVREKGILEAWREQESNPVVKRLSDPVLADVCSDCPLRRKCRGGCFARAKLMTGDLFAPDPLCPKVAGLI